MPGDGDEEEEEDYGDGTILEFTPHYSYICGLRQVSSSTRVTVGLYWSSYWMCLRSWVICSCAERYDVMLPLRDGMYI